jgi:hypothetical protein
MEEEIMKQPIMDLYILDKFVLFLEIINNNKSMFRIVIYNSREDAEKDLMHEEKHMICDKLNVIFKNF